MSFTNQSPFKVKELDVEFPTTGKTKAYCHARNGVILVDNELPGFTDIHLPADVLLKEPDIQSKVDWMLYMLNEMDSSPANAEVNADFDDGTLNFVIKSQTNRVELKDKPLFQVITRKKLFEEGMYDIHDDAIITQDEQLAKKMCSEQGSLSMVFEVHKKPSELTPEEAARVINDPRAGVTIAKVVGALERYGVEGSSYARDSAELVLQSLRDVDPQQKNLVELYFNKRNSVHGAIAGLIADQRFAPNPIPAYDRAKNENGMNDLFTSLTNNVSKGDVDGEYLIDIPNDGPVKVSKDEPSQNEQENGITSIRRKM